MTFLEKTLFTRNTTTPKSYVVGFKYVGDTFSGVIYNGRIYSNAQVHFRCIIIRGLSLETVGSKEKKNSLSHSQQRTSTQAVI